MGQRAGAGVAGVTRFETHQISQAKYPKRVTAPESLECVPV